MTVGTGECTMCTERKRGGNEMWGRLCPPLGQDCLPGTHLWWGPLSQFLAPGILSHDISFHTHLPGLSIVLVHPGL